MSQPNAARAPRRALLAKADVEGRKTVTILSPPGNAIAQAEAAIVAAGWKVLYRDAEFGYNLAGRSTGKVLGVASAASVEAVDSTRSCHFDSEARGRRLVPATPRRPDATTPEPNPYMPIQDTARPRSWLRSRVGLAAA